MQEHQEPFYQFIMDCVQIGKEGEAKDLLMENFKRQCEGTFSKAELERFHTEIVKILKPERREEVVAVMKQFGNDHVSR